MLFQVVQFVLKSQSICTLTDCKIVASVETVAIATSAVNRMKTVENNKSVIIIGCGVGECN